MTLGLHESRRSGKRQRRSRILRGLLVTVVLIALGIVAYLVGSDLAQKDVAQLREVNRDLTERLAVQSQRGNRLQALLDAAQSSERTWRERYTRDVPTGGTQTLVSQIQAHLTAGADPDRIKMFVDAASRPPRCDNAPATKRFFVRTPLYRGANDSVSFANNALTVTGAGRAATDAASNPEEWFDPAFDITVEITSIGGEVSEKSGPLPLHQAIVWGGAEYRFSVVKGETRGFVSVTVDRCALQTAE